MAYILASDGLAPWGQAAAIILALYLFISIVVGLALVAALMFGLSWVREKAELLRQLRPQIMQVNRVVSAVKRGDPLPHELADNKIIATVAQVPGVLDKVAARTSSIEQSVERGSTRVANAVIEFHARTAMVKGMARAFFLPGQTGVRPAASVGQPGKQEQEREQIAVPGPQREESPRLEEEIVITQSSR